MLSPVHQDHPETVDPHFGFQISPALRVSDNADRLVLFDTDAGHVYLCDGLKAAYWRAITRGDRPSAITKALSAEAGRTKDSIAADLQSFLEDLQLRRLVRPLHSTPLSLAQRIMLIARAAWGLIAYDLQLRTLGFGSIYTSVSRSARMGNRARRDLTAFVVRAVSIASSVYWRPVRCLQRSVVTARLLKSFGVRAELVIGYRLAPFFAHAWVELDGEVISDSPRVRDILTILDRI